MSPERWAQVEELYHAVLEQTPGARALLLEQADPELRREVESLLAQPSGNGALERPAWADSDEPSAIEKWSAGSLVGPYRLESPIGKGGMGEVWKARDQRLGRWVAIKTSAARFSDRFEREARAISALNHPNICTLYDVGPDYLVMEYVEGSPIKGPLPVEQTLKYAAQICDALDAAHRRGITHRDLKPGNILLSKQGIKLLDFGLAQMQPGPDDPTMMPMTQTGAVMGTPSYMAPEQWEGKKADARSDLYSLGCVLYEILTGKRGGTERAAVVRPLEDILRTCLEKDPGDRWQSARELKHALRWAADARPVTAPPSWSHPGKTGWILAGLLALAAAALGFVLFHQRPTPAPQVFRTTIEPPPKTRVTNFALSPDGRSLAIAATGEHGDQIWVRSLDSFQLQPLAGTEGGAFPFWSADSRSIGFFAEEKLKRISADGGPVQTVCDAPNALGGTWSAGNVIVFGSTVTGLRRVNAADGNAVLLTGKPSARSPAFLPDGRRFLYEVTGKDAGVYVGSVDAASGASETLVTSGASNPQYLPPSAESAHGYILFVRDQTLMAKPVDPNSLASAGDPFPLFDQVASLPGDNNYFLYSLSRNGMIVHQPTRLLQHTFLDRGGRPLATIADPAPTQGRVALSPDGNRIIFERGVGGKIDLWMTEVDHGLPSRLTFDSSMNLSPVWSPEGNRVAFSSNRRGNFDLYLTASNQAGIDKLLRRAGGPGPLTATDWTRDGRFLIVQENGAGPAAAGSYDLFALPVDGGMAVPLLNTAANEIEGVVSPDGRWLAYASDESGRDEVYVQPFAPASSHAAGGKSQISTSGGRDPHWRGDGRELFYVSSDRKMMAVGIKPDREGLAHGSPQGLFDVHFYTDVTLSRYAVSSDGQRFLAAVPAETFSEGLIHLTVNWLAGVGK